MSVPNEILSEPGADSVPIRTRRPARETIKIIKREYVLYLFLVPAVGFVFVFMYLPLFINVIAFMDYDLFDGWLGLGSPFVGLKHFKTFLSNSDFYTIALRTLYYSFVKPLLLNELRIEGFKRVTQTISYLPHFVSWVTVSSLVYLFLSTSSTGFVNNIIEALGGNRILFMGRAQYFLPVLVVTDVWKGVGFGSIIYIAAIASIDLQLYEAAKIDGAGRWQRMIHITLPGIMPATIILLILSMGVVFNANFDQVFTLQNEVIRQDTMVINVYSYWIGIAQRKYSLSTAINLFQGLINFVLVWTTNYISKRVRGTALF